MGEAARNLTPAAIGQAQFEHAGAAAQTHQVVFPVLDWVRFYLNFAACRN